MKILLLNYKNGRIKLADLPVPLPGYGEILVETKYSLISAGTERNTISLSRKNIFQKALERPDLVKRVLDFAKKSGVSSAYSLVKGKLDSYIPLGYSSSGVVVEVGEGVSEFKVGDLVACCGQGIAYHGEYTVVPKNMAVKLPENLSLKEGAFGTIGAIAMQGVRQLGTSPGEKILVVGMGLIGEMAYLILKHSGVNVSGCDINKDRVDSLREKNFEVYENKYVSENFLSLTEGIGFDKVIITASDKSGDTLKMAGKVLRKRGVLVVLGNVKMDFEREEYYRKEIEIRFSTSYGPGRYDRKYEVEGIDYPLPYVRWTLKRNIFSFLEMVKNYGIDLEGMISHVFPIEDYKKAYDILLGGEKNFSAIMFEYGVSSGISRKISYGDIKGMNRGEVKIGVIGAGNFAKNFILPILKRRRDVIFHSIVTKNGYSQEELKEKFGFKVGYTNYVDMLDGDFDALFIFTRHDLHQKLVIEGVKSGKFVFCEKPLSIDEGEYLKFKEMVLGNEDVFFTVGFNRRFSPHSLKIKEFFRDRRHPLTFYYRVNCGFLPEDSWIYSREGGGRIISEVCHFLDLMVFLSGERIKKVTGKAIRGVNGRYEDNFLIEVSFERGSLGTVLYSNLMSEGIPKEYVEINGYGKTAFLNNFKEVLFWEKGGKRRISSGFDKGYDGEINAFLDWVKGGGAPPIAYEEIFNVTEATFSILKSLEKGVEIEVEI